MISRRRNAILHLVGTRVVHSIDELRELLLSEGIEAPPPAVARDVKMLGLVRTGLRDANGKQYHKYVVPGSAARYPSQLHRIVAELVDSVTGAENLIVVKTPPGSASMVAAELDGAAWPEIIGTIAGDDTIIAVCASKAQSPKVTARFKEMRELKARPK